MLGRPAAWTAVQPNTGRWAAIVPVQQQQQAAGVRIPCRAHVVSSSRLHIYCVPAWRPTLDLQNCRSRRRFVCHAMLCVQVVAIVGQLIGNAK